MVHAFIINITFFDTPLTADIDPQALCDNGTHPFPGQVNSGGKNAAYWINVPSVLYLYL